MLSSVVYKKEEQEEEISVEGVFISIGSIPVTEFIGDLVDFTEETKTPGLFAAGDVTNVRDKQIIIASAEGAKSAISAYKYIRD